ncbi:hypothetical protein Emed_006738 [Eimeria media]
MPQLQLELQLDPVSSRLRGVTPDPSSYTSFTPPRRSGTCAIGAAVQAAEAEWLADGNHPRFILRLQDQLLQQTAEIQRLQCLVTQSREVAIERDSLHRENRDQRQRLQRANEIIEDLHRHLDSYRLKVIDLKAQLSSASSQQDWVTQAERFRSQLTTTESELAFLKRQYSDSQARNRELEQHHRIGLETRARASYLETEVNRLSTTVSHQAQELREARSVITYLKEELKRKEVLEFYSPETSPVPTKHNKSVETPSKKPAAPDSHTRAVNTLTCPRSHKEIRA